MFKLTRSKYIDVLASAEKLEETLRVENNKLLVSCQELSTNWKGAQAEKSLGYLKSSLNENNHKKALTYTHGMVKIMSEYRLEIEKMMAKREQIGKQLKQDAYTMPDLTNFHESQLIVDYDSIEDVVADVEGAIMYGDLAADVLEDMITDAETYGSEYVNLAAVKDMLKAAKKKLHRIENYRDEFVDFGKKMSDMEYNFSIDLSQILNTQGGAVVKNVAMQAGDVVMQSKIGKIKDNIDEVSTGNIEVIAKTKTKFIKTSEILKKDPENATEEEQTQVADVFAEIYEIFNGKTQELIEEAAKTVSSYTDAFYDFKHSVEGKLEKIEVTEWIDKVKENLSDEYEECKELLNKLKEIPGENVKETFDNINDMSGGRFKTEIYRFITFCAENDLEGKTKKLYDFFQYDTVRPIQKLVINSGLFQPSSKLEGWFINDFAKCITKELLGFRYNEDSDSYYTQEGSLQNAWGFGAAIDQFAPLLGMDLYHKNIVFKIDDKEYLVELWKGEYGWGITSGGEIGIYTRILEPGSKEYKEGEDNFDIYYDCAEGDDQLRMVTTMYDMSNGNKREICTKDTVDSTKDTTGDGTDYWNLNFKSYDAVDKEDIRMEATLEGKVEIIAGIKEYYDRNGMEGVVIKEKDDNEDDDKSILIITWEAECEKNKEN